MPNIPPVDLTDEKSVRDYLLRLGEQAPILGSVSSNLPITNLYKLPVLSDTSLTEYVQTVVGEFNDTLRDAVDEVNNILEGNYAQVLLLNSELNENYATVDVIAGTYATQDEVGAIYEVSVEANGHVSGYRSVATGTTAIFEIYAEKFAVSSSATEEGYSPFQIDTVNHKVNFTADVAIDGNLVVTRSIVATALAANSITADEIAANEITANEIAANTITALEIGAQAITATEIAANTITANEIAANTITANEITTGILLVDAKIESTNYSWNGGSPIGFSMWSTGDLDSGQSYNIIGGKIYGTDLTGVTLNIQDINLKDNAGQNVAASYMGNATTAYSAPVYTISTGIKTTGNAPYHMLPNQCYVSVSSNVSPSSGGFGPDRANSAWLFSCDDSSVPIVIKDGTTTKASGTLSSDTTISVGGFRFTRVTDGSYANQYHYYMEGQSEPTVTSTNGLNIELTQTDTIAFSFLTDSLTWLISNI